MDIPGASSASGEESSGVVLGHQRTSSQELSQDTPLVGTLVGTQPSDRVAPVAVQQDQDQEVQEESAPGGKTRLMTGDEKRRAMHLLFQGVSARKVAKILGRGKSAISALRCDCACSNAPPRTPRNARPVLHQTSPCID